MTPIGTLFAAQGASVSTSFGLCLFKCSISQLLFIIRINLSNFIKRHIFQFSHTVTHVILFRIKIGIGQFRNCNIQFTDKIQLTAKEEPQ